MYFSFQSSPRYFFTGSPNLRISRAFSVSGTSRSPPLPICSRMTFQPHLLPEVREGFDPAVGVFVVGVDERAVDVEEHGFCEQLHAGHESKTLTTGAMRNGTPPIFSGAGSISSITARSASRSSPASTSIRSSWWRTAFSRALIVYCAGRPRCEDGHARVTLTGVAELFYHWNVRTPYWLGLRDPAAGSASRASPAGTCTRSTTATCRCGTCCSARSAIRRRGMRNAASAEERELRVGDLLLGRDVNP